MSKPPGWNAWTSADRLKSLIPIPDNEAELDRMAEKASDEVEAFVAATARCCAVLFPLPLSELTAFVLWTGELVHPDIARRCGHVHGPAPLACKRKPHPRGTWHWNEGTWWR